MRKELNFSAKQGERLSFIEFLLMFKGSVNRADLISKFGIQQSAATNDFRAYRQHAPTNLYLDPTTKHYFIDEDRFSPLFEMPFPKAVSMLQDPEVAQLFNFSDLYGISGPPRLCTPSLDTLQKVTRAIATKSPLQLKYYSAKEVSTRVLIPHSIVDSGLRLHIRAFSRGTNEKPGHFGDFVLNRCSDLSLLREAPEAHEQLENDKQWNEIVSLELVPHPNKENVQNPEAIARDYGMEKVDDPKQLKVRAALAGYWLRLWNVDCSDRASLQGKEYQLWLRNVNSIKDKVDNLFLAPGGLTNRKSLQVEQSTSSTT